MRKEFLELISRQSQGDLPALVCSWRINFFNVRLVRLHLKFAHAVKQTTFMVKKFSQFVVNLAQLLYIPFADEKKATFP